jgi:hypothetical protein
MALWLASCCGRLRVAFDGCFLLCRGGKAYSHTLAKLALEMRKLGYSNVSFRSGPSIAVDVLFWHCQFRGIQTAARIVRDRSFRDATDHNRAVHRKTRDLQRIWRLLL